MINATGIGANASYNKAVLSSVEPEEVEISYPGARAPDRRRVVDADGIRIAVYEWGEPDAPPLALVHGGFDFARTFDVFAPLLADAGYRVVSWDQRGHGDSEHTALYSWWADGADLSAVVESISPEPFPVIGHSKGGGMLLNAISRVPSRFSRFVAIDGLPARPVAPMPNQEESDRMCKDLAGWLDHRRALDADSERRPGSVDELATRRALMNPRLDHNWLRYLVQHGARHDSDGWRWKIDPCLRILRFGPWRWFSHAPALREVALPLLALLSSVDEPMGWGLTAADVKAFMPPQGELVVMPQTGHFIHIERPRETAALVLEFLKS